MGDLYDDKIETMLVTRQRMSEQKRIQRQKELQKQYCILAGALVALLIVIVIIVKGCSGEKKTNPKDKVGSTTTTEQLTTLPEETTIEETTVVQETTVAVSNIMYTTDVLNFRTAPNTEADLIRHLDKGTEVKVISTNDGWCEVEYGNHIGYVNKEYLSTTKPE